MSCGGGQPAAPTSTQAQQLTVIGVVTLGELNPSAQLHLLSGNTEVSHSATWQSSNPSVATVFFGLVNATGLGTTTITASYQNQTDSFMMSVAPDQDCIRYDSSNVSMMTDAGDPTIQDITAPVPGVPAGDLGLLAFADNQTDAVNLVALFQRYNLVCYVGRNFGQKYTLSYFKAATGRQTTIAPEDCVSYSAGALQVANQGGQFAVVTGGTQLALFPTVLEASLAEGVAAQASNECYIGRRNTRPTPYGFITEYWR
jgi:hypothetical protein